MAKTRQTINPHRRNSTAALGLAAAVFALGLAEAAGAGPMPHALTSCPDCHFSVADADGGLAWFYVKPPSQMCSPCHDDKLVNPFHPVSAATGPGWDSQLPRDEFGRMTCISCHDLHPSGGDEAAGMIQPALFRGDPGQDSGLLRAELREQGCQACHQDSSGLSAGQNAHRSALFPIHRPAREPLAAAEAAELDPVSLTCLGCHDGSLTASRVETRIVLDPDSTPADPFGPHPVGTPYRVRPGRYRLVPVSLLDENILLFEGRIGCGSCHNLYAHHPKLLAVDTQVRSLCRSCHDFGSDSHFAGNAKGPLN